MDVLSNKTNIICSFLIILCILFVSYKAISMALEHKNQWYAFDGGEDAMTIMGGIHYAENGFMSNAGLQYRCSEKPLLSWEKRGLVKSDCVTLAHYPQLQAWIAGLLIKIIGKEKIHNGELHYYRFFPVATGIISLILLAYMLVSTFNIVRAAIMIAAVSTIEMTSNMMAHLGMHGYTFPFLLLQIGVFFYIFKKKDKIKIKYFIILFFLGFLQGWLTFDYFFLVSFSAIPFALLYSHVNKGENKKRLFYAIIFPLTGFALAHLLHFAQFAVYLGSITDVLNDLVDTAKYRSEGGSEHIKFQYEQGQGTEKGRIQLLKEYINWHADQPPFFSGFTRPFKKFLIIIFILTLFKDVRINITRPFKAVLRWTSSNHTSLAILAAFLVSFLWMLVMKQFAASPWFVPYVTRHFFLVYFVCVLTVVESLSVESTP